jgi:drug/metabolite transporter (DMT)-like permease
LSFVFAPLFLCIIIFQTNPFWIAMLGQCINSEKVQRVEYIGMLLCFFGVCGIGLSSVLGKENSPELGETTESEANFDNFIVLGLMLVFAAAWSFSVNCVLNRTLKEISFSVVMFYHGLIGVVLTIMFISGDMVVNGSDFRLAQYPSHIFWLTVFSGLLDGLRGYCMTIAFQSDSSGFVSLFGYINVAYAFAADVFIFKETFGVI